MMRFTYLSFLLFISIFSIAQIHHPASGWLYDATNVSRIDISIDMDSLAEILAPANALSDHEFKADMIFTRNGQSDTVSNVGFRLRGNTSRVSEKKSFKISINTFTSGRRYQDVKDMNINGEHNDPSISRSRLCWELGAAENLPVSRVAHTELYINGVYYGLYINVEHINNDWLGLRFGNNSGNLYKCTYPATLRYISNNSNDYKFTNGDGIRIYELKTNESADDYSDLAHFIDVLNNTPLSQLECALDDVFNVEGYLETLAFEVTCGHWDNYSFNKNNFYLYKNQETGKFEFIPYDMDNTFGVDWFNVDWASRNVLNWGNSGEYLPLSDRILAIPELNEIYKFYLAKFNQKFGSMAYQNSIDYIYNQIKTYAQADTFKSLDYGFTNIDFKNSFDSTQAQQHVKKGIKTYLNQRVAATNNQLGTFNSAPIVRYVKLKFGALSSEAYVSAFVIDETSVNVKCEYSINGGNTQNINLFDDGNHNDGAAGDGFYGGTIINLTSGNISYQVTATDVTSKSRTRPCNAANVSIPVPKALVINEFMADNDNVIADNQGDYSDWIELYNNTNDSIFLGDYFLTDKLSDSAQWALPNEYLPASGYKIIWASGDTTKGDDHANFKLSKGGEEIGLFYNNSGAFDTADFIIFGTQSTDISYGRKYDASPIWIFFTNPSPNFSNYPLGFSQQKEKSGIRVYPNPYSKDLFIENLSNQNATVKIYSVLGNLLFTKELSAFEKFQWEDKDSNCLRLVYILKNNGVEVIKVIAN